MFEKELEKIKYNLAEYFDILRQFCLDLQEKETKLTCRLNCLFPAAFYWSCEINRIDYKQSYSLSLFKIKVSDCGKNIMLDFFGKYDLVENKEHLINNLKAFLNSEKVMHDINFMLALEK